MPRSRIGVRVRLDKRNLDLLRRHLNHDLRGGGRGPFGQCLERWGERYLDDIQQHMGAEGEGRYKQLAPRTQTERAKLGFPAAHPMLVRLGLLIAALRRGNAANFFARITRGVRVGFKSGVKHPGYRATSGKIVGGGQDIATIAAAHNQGAPGRNLPKRAILVTPKQATVFAMLGDLARAFSYFRRS